MATIVLVHGIAAERKRPIPSKLNGCRRCPRCRLSRDRRSHFGHRAAEQAISARMAFYCGLHLKRDPQGGEFDADEAAMAEALAIQWLEPAAAQAPRPSEKATAAGELAIRPA